MSNEQQKETKMELASEYDASQIQVLKGLDAVRKRPGMYIGSTSAQGLHHLVWEIVDNGIDEALAGFCDEINVVVNPDNSITVKDNGRGIPVDTQKETGKSALETVFTVLHAGGKFGGGGYKVSGGLHGVGASVVNALSTELDVKVARQGKRYYMDFDHGHVKSAMKVIEEGLPETEHGTTVHFKPDPEIFRETTTYNIKTLTDRLRELAFLNKGLKITIEDLRQADHERKEFHYEGGIRHYVEYLNEDQNVLFDPPIYVEGKENDITVEVSLQYTDSYRSNLLTFTNNIHTYEGGTHETGFKMALTRVINDYGHKAGVLKSNETLSGDDVREGLTAVVSIKHPDPQFEGQTKTKLGNSDARTATDHVFAATFNRFLLEHPDEARQIIEKGQLASKARVAAKRAREVTRKKSGLEISNLPGKLADNTSKDPEISELFIVEGDSAGGSAKQGRSRLTQAILPIRGKILNVDRVLANDEIRSLFTALGTGFGDDFDITKANYHKLIIMTDADVDGAHIRTLLLTLFYRFMKPMITHGYVYIAQPPLYQVRQGKFVKYIDSDEELEQVVSSLQPSPKPVIQRYKGLGEMDAEQLWETTMDPENRHLLRVKLDDAEQADKIFPMLMGTKVGPRRDFIEQNAKFVENLDL